MLLIPIDSPVHARQPMRTDRIVLVTTGGEKPIEIEVAESIEEKSLGLMFRSSLADDKGMLFPYQGAQEITMWMKNTYISLDMIFIRADGRILRIAENTEPESTKIISSGGLARGVLELPAGSAQKYGIAPGDRVSHPLFGKR